MSSVDEQIPALLRAAAEARTRAYAPYSRFSVGAAVLAGGRVFAAGNVENSAYPLCVCAERNAVAIAVAAGHRRIDAVAVVAGKGAAAPPCGGCRQVLSEFCPPQTPVVYAAADGAAVTTTLAELLPHAFGPGDLVRAKAGSTGSSRRPPGRRRTAAPSRGTRRNGRSRSR